jgi:hypothetical protein
MKLYAYLIAAVALIVGAGGLWWYVDHLQDERKILIANNAQLDDALAREKKSTATLRADALFKDEQLQTRMDQLQNALNINARLHEKIRETENQATLECLGTVPSDDFIFELRKHSEGQSRDRGGLDVPESSVLSE